jgi:tRNA 2-thiouridine synthesizing protein A
MNAWRAGRRGSRGSASTAAHRAGADGTAAPGAAAPDTSTQGPEAAAPEAALTVDALGRKCPVPIIMLAERIRDVPVGSVIAVLADDPAAQTDIPAWCRMKSQQFVTEVPLERGWSLLVRRAY